MSLRDTVQAAIEDIISIEDVGDGVYVNTLCIYPSNGFVQVVVRGGENTFSVSDNGGAVNELEVAGVPCTKSDSALGRVIEAQGLIVKDGVIRSPLISREALPVAIALVANASKDLADWLFATSKVKRTRDFKRIVREFLHRTFDAKALNDETIVGASNKPHKFDNLIVLPNGRRFIVDPVIHDASSINARVVANLDVRLAKIDGLEQRIVYDDEEDWRPEDLNLLQVGADVIAFSKSAEVIRRIVA